MTEEIKIKAVLTACASRQGLFFILVGRQYMAPLAPIGKEGYTFKVKRKTK